MSDKKIVITLDSSELATILAALRLFQKEYEDCDSVSIADAWPMHFNVQGEDEEMTVEPQPLGSEDINTLCERINCSPEVSHDPALVAEVKELLSNATYADGYATCLTQDMEALEAIGGEVKTS